MKTIRETWILFVHYEKLLVRNPYWLLSALLEPICYLYLFAPLLKNIIGQTGTNVGNEINLFNPGLLVMVSLYGVMFVGFGMIDYLREGIIERLRVTTDSRLALLLGLVARDVCMLLVQTVIIILCALLLGLKLSARSNMSSMPPVRCSTANIPVRWSGRASSCSVCWPSPHLPGACGR
jgi:ABC-2 type transport system permease protein